ncbi:Nuclear pore complex protein Nup85 [Psidium guajava]|nr:Nuclear pore complex protein Nup85 [Psidium guajava]
MWQRESAVIIYCSNPSVVVESDRERECTAMEDQPKESSSFIPGATSSSTSTERCDSGPSDSVDVMEEEFNIFFNQQQQNGRTIPRGRDEDTRQESDSEPSASYTSVLGNNYYVFLSFRGPDTRTGFSDHLYHRLVDVGLHHPDFVFRDDEELRFGQPIGDNLLDAIERSKISIPVISETYAASEWCLREIIKIMDCVERGQQKVYPVLYKVEPRDVRHMLGKFGDAFRRHQHGFAKEVQQKGPEALKKAVERKIYESEKVAGGHEGKFVKELVETIRREQQHEFSPSLP